MKRVLIAIAIAMVAVAATPLEAHQKGHGKGAAKHESAVSDAPHVSADIHFSVGEQRVIREYYAPRYQSLPPGLQKKVARGKPLPPGISKRVLPADLLVYVPRDANTTYYIVGDRIVAVRNGTIIDVLLNILR